MTTSVQPPVRPKGFRTFLVLWATQTISVVGDLITYFAITLWLTTVAYPDDGDRAELAFAFSAMMVGSAVVALAGGTFIGVLVDRQDRRRLMVIGNAGNAIISTVLAVLAATDNLTLWLLLPIVWIAAGVGELHFLSLEASYIMLVSEDEMPRANAMMGSTFAVAEVVAPPLTILLMAFATDTVTAGGTLGSLIETIGGHLAGGAPFVFALDAVTFVVSAVTVYLVAVPTPVAVFEHEERVSLWRDARRGLRYLLDERPLLVLLSMSTVFALAGAVAQVLLPLLVRFNLEDDWTARGWTLEGSLAVITTAAGIAGIAGGALVSVWGGLRKHLVIGTTAPMLAFVLLQVALGLSRSIIVATVIWVVASMLLPVMRAHSLTLWQTRTPIAMQGRIFSMRRLLTAGAVPLGAALGGWLGGWLDPGYVIAGFGAIAALYIGIQMFSPALRQVEAMPQVTATAD